jgi:hypothetical protein
VQHRFRHARSHRYPYIISMFLYMGADVYADTTCVRKSANIHTNSTRVYMRVCLCVCVYLHSMRRRVFTTYTCMRVRVYTPCIGGYLYICLCVCRWLYILHSFASLYIYIYIHTHTRLCIHVCVCVCILYACARARMCSWHCPRISTTSPTPKCPL